MAEKAAKKSRKLTKAAKEAKEAAKCGKTHKQTKGGNSFKKPKGERRQRQLSDRSKNKRQRQLKAAEEANQETSKNAATGRKKKTKGESSSGNGPTPSIPVKRCKWEPKNGTRQNVAYGQACLVMRNHCNFQRSPFLGRNLQPLRENEVRENPGVKNQKVQAQRAKQRQCSVMLETCRKDKAQKLMGGRSVKHEKERPEKGKNTP